MTYAYIINAILISGFLYLMRLTSKVKDHPEMGKDLYPVKFSKDNYAFPVVWVSKHLSNTDEDNILHKYHSWKRTLDLFKKA